MKKTVALVLVLVIAIAVAGCGKPEGLSEYNYARCLTVLEIADEYIDGKVKYAEAHDRFSEISDSLESGSAADLESSLYVLRLSNAVLNHAYGKITGSDLILARNEFAKYLGEKLR